MAHSHIRTRGVGLQNRNSRGKICWFSCVYVGLWAAITTNVSQTAMLTYEAKQHLTITYKYIADTQDELKVYADILENENYNNHVH